MAGVGDLVTRLIMDSTNFDSTINRSQREINAFRVRAESVGRGVNSVFNGMAGAALKLVPVIAAGTTALGAFNKIINNSGSLADSLDKVMLQVGSSIDYVASRAADLNFDNAISGLRESVRLASDLADILDEISTIKKDYDRLRAALQSVRNTGYGVVMPDSSQMQLEEPKIVRQGGKYTVKLKANAPAIHMIMTNIETEVTPAIGGETASEDIINFLLQGFDGDVNRIWQSNIFGKSLYDIAEEGLYSKIEALPDNAKQKLQDTLQRIINEGSGGLICILL